MTAHPELQAKAQAEIDNVVGSGRLPTLADRAQLPFVEAVVLEVYRYGEVLPLGVAHRVIDDDMYHGYYIPKNSLVIPNMW
jgi:cytochrome P450